MAVAAKIANRAKAKSAKSKGSDSSSDSLDRADVSSSDEERAPKKSTKKTAVSEERAAKVINQFTFSLYNNIHEPDLIYFVRKQDRPPTMPLALAAPLSIEVETGKW